MLKGRGLRNTDTSNSIPVLVVNQTFADRYFPRSRSDRTARPDRDDHCRAPAARTRNSWEIVGVVATNGSAA